LERTRRQALRRIGFRQLVQLGPIWETWVIDKLAALTKVFALDLCAYSILSSHFHLILRLDPDSPRAWSDEDVLVRYGRLFRSPVEGARKLPPAKQKERVATFRSRLQSLSWFMRCLNESIARRANQEDRCTGRFWEGRFRSQPLLDEGALLTCMSYVDLNPVRAGLADFSDGGLRWR
jgi:putative transposase